MDIFERPCVNAESKQKYDNNIEFKNETLDWHARGPRSKIVRLFGAMSDPIGKGCLVFCTSPNT